MATETPLDRVAAGEAVGAEPRSSFRPFVDDATILPEFTFRAVALGAILGIVFGASSVYLGLKVGLTVSASIPIAVLAITIFRAFGKASILENNITQTTGSAGESIAAGVVFTIPALLILGYDLEISRVALIALTGGWLGVLLMIPLRRALIVKEHGRLKYPEGTACAEVLKVGELGGLQAKLVFGGFFVGLVYKFMMQALHLWKEAPSKILFPKDYPNGTIAAEVSPELLGVGYIIGPRVAGIMAAGGVMSYLVLIPLISMFGAGLTTPLFPATSKLISAMGAGEIRGNYVYYIGAGAVAAGGIISLARSLPTIIGAFTAAMKDLRGTGAGSGDQRRTERDIPITWVLGGVAIVVIILALLPQLQVGILGALLMAVFGFFFVTVSSRITGELGSSSNPVSGMTIATLLLTCLIFLLLGRTGTAERVVALSIGAVVCIAASNGGATSQDLKTGFLVGATPKFQQYGLLIGVTTAAVVIGWTLWFLSSAFTTLEPSQYPAYTANVASLTETKQGPDNKPYRVLRLNEEANGVPRGQYLVDDAGAIRFTIDPGVGGHATTKLVEMNGAPPAGVAATEVKALGYDGQNYTVYKAATAEAGYLVDDAGQVHYRQEPVSKLEAPKAQLMALIIDGILEQKLPWGFVLLGIFISIGLELAGVSALPFAVGLYLPLSTSATIFVGGIVRWAIEKYYSKGSDDESDADSSRGVLFSSGLIAGGSIAGLLYAAIAWRDDIANALNLSRSMHFLEESNVLPLIPFAILVAVLVWVSREKRDDAAV